MAKHHLPTNTKTYTTRRIDKELRKAMDAVQKLLKKNEYVYIEKKR